MDDTTIITTNDGATIIAAVEAPSTVIHTESEGNIDALVDDPSLVIRVENDTHIITVADESSVIIQAVDPASLVLEQQGDIGPQGETGPPGETSPQGETGPRGEPGAASTVPGPKGDKGDKGDQGDIGFAGNTGATGADGHTPIKGVDYLDGLKGDRGDTGADGKTILYGSGVPDGGFGVTGDFYIDVLIPSIYGPKSGTNWGVGFSLIGPAGGDGVDGAAGANGHSVLSGSGVPGAGLGVNGDFYINVSVPNIYGPKTGGAWGAATTLVGPQGAAGAPGVDGKTVRNGAGVPGGGLGVDGDFYLNTTNDDLYGPKTGGLWGSPVSLRGPQGDQGGTGAAGANGTNGTNGTNGVDGADGVDGQTVLNGGGAPAVGLGADGDFYIDTTNNDLYGPKNGGAWGVGTSWVGPKGEQGVQGETGAPGNLNYEGAWVTATLYHVNDILKGADLLFYRCTVQHTSGATTEPGVGASWETDWELFGGGGGGGAGSFGVSIDGGGQVIPAGTKQYLIMPFACTITGWRIVGSPAGDVVMDVWKAAGAIPTVTDSITGTEKPSLSGATVNSGTVVSWIKAVAEGDVIVFNVDSCLLCQKLTLAIAVLK